ncbi:MAG: aminotransferase class IV [Aeoliella sp.]
MSERQAYYSGKWIPESQLAIPVGDLGFALGVTVTERLRTFGGRLFRKREHLVRMQHSLAIVGLPAVKLCDEIGHAIDEFLERHEGQIEPGDDWGIVAFATPGSGVVPTVCVHGSPIPFGEWANQYTEGVRTYVSQHRQVPPNCWPAELKCRSRMHYYLADREAKANDSAARAVLTDQDGFIAETPTANLVVFHAGQGLITPRFSRVLHGVSVGVIEELAEGLGVSFSEGEVTVDEFLAADEIWLTSTSICMLPIVACNGTPIGSGKPGREYARFLSAWAELVGVDIIAQAELRSAFPA